MSYLLRHHPEAAGLEMGRRGWVSLDDLVAACTRSGHARDRGDVLRVVRENDKQRFQISADGSALRAVQGHSLDLDLELEPAFPPPRLFHGTVGRFVDRIRREGLRPMGRTHVHLSPHVEAARRVGRRRGRPVVLEIDAKAMAAAGWEFFEAANGVWLVSVVPPEYIHVPSEPRRYGDCEPEGSGNG